MRDVTFVLTWRLTAGQNPDWKLDKVEVRNLQTGQAATFVCNKWLSQTKDDRMIERELFVDSADAAASFVHWRVCILVTF